MKTSFLAPVRVGGMLGARPRWSRGERRVAFAEAEVVDDAGTVVARSSSTYLFTAPRLPDRSGPAGCRGRGRRLARVGASTRRWGRPTPPAGAHDEYEEDRGPRSKRNGQGLGWAEVERERDAPAGHRLRQAGDPDPLKGLGRFMVFGVAGSVALAIGLVILSVAFLRLLQGETGSTFTGNWSWAPVPDLHRRRGARRRPRRPGGEPGQGGPPPTDEKRPHERGSRTDHPRPDRGQVPRADR